MQTLLRAIRDPALFGPFFRDASTWSSWMITLKALFGISLEPNEVRLFQQSSGRSKPFVRPAREGWFICGRRSGKSFIAALVAVYLATFRDYSEHLSPGERGVVMVLAPNRTQARVIFRYIEAFIDGIAFLSKLVVGRTADSIDLSNRIAIEVHTASFRAVRGYTVVAAICDEIAFWRDDESANPDKAVLDALRPAMATIPGALLLCLSSPYARRGALYEAFERYHGNDEADVLVWRAPTSLMNPTINPAIVKADFDRDPTAAAAEWGAEFRSDVTSFLEEDWITGAIDNGCHERPPVSRFQYVAFVDPSGGKRDSFTVAVAHKQSELLLLDMAREFRAPLDPATVVGEIAGLLAPYGIRSVTGDAYAGEWPAAAFRDVGLHYSTAERNRSEIYLETGPLLAQGQIRLIDSARLTLQLRQLERRTSQGGRDRVNHPPGGHDDIANSAMGALLQAAKQTGRIKPTRTREQYAEREDDLA